MVFNATFNNISVISWQSVLFVEETGVPWEFLVVIGTDCIGSCKSNYHTIMTTTTPKFPFAYNIICFYWSFTYLNPSCLQMTLAVTVVNEVDETVPHTPFTLTSSLPSKQLEPFTKRISAD
jgi:hypothetical protein